MKEIIRYTDHECSKCGKKWTETLMIFGENNEVRILDKREWDEKWPSSQYGSMEHEG